MTHYCEQVRLLMRNIPYMNYP